MIETVTIARLGAQGDGIAPAEGGPLYVPFTLPGERVRIAREGKRGWLEAVEAPSPDRREPPCPHFGTCGGCDLQHADEALYRSFKRDLVVEALAREGIEAEVAALVPCPPASRRRVVLSAARAGTRLLLGYNEAMTNRIVAIETCPIAEPKIVAALPALRRLSAILLDRKKPLRLTVTATLAGLDISAEDNGRLDAKTRQNAVALALEAGFARLSTGGEVLVESRPPAVDVGGIAVRLPPGAFVQAVASAEGAMAALVLDHLGSAKRVIDLFSGFGTFGLRLARGSAVHCVEGEAAPLASLDAAVRATQGLKPVTQERRDLFRRPVTAKELSRFDALVFDPPRAGAEAQCREIAASKIRRVAAVSCNPMTLARDLKILTDGGFRVRGVTPIDQFLWSHHVEAVALLER